MPLADLKVLIQQTGQCNPRDPLLASLYAQMGRVYRNRLEDGEAQDYPAESTLAIEYMQKAIELQKELGQDLDLAISLNRLALLYKSQGRYSEAEPLYLQALDIRRSQLGQDHPDTAISLWSLGAMYYSMQRFNQAEPPTAQALDIFQQCLDDHHPYTIACRNWLETIRAAKEQE